MKLSNNIGIHLKDETKEGFEKIKDYPINYIQIFSTESPYKINKLAKKYKLKVILHASYTINLAQKFDINSIFLEFFVGEIKYADMINAKYVVIHIGKLLKLNIDDAKNNIVLSLIYAINNTEQYKNVTILLETSSGQGSEIGTSFEELADIYNRVKHINRIKICLDTCHVYTGGYDLNDFELFKTKFDKTIGLKNIKVVHLNNSKFELGAHIDRHSNINDGNIKNLVEIAVWFIKYNNAIIILETPHEHIANDIESLIDFK